jgi:hypothetical protein
MWLTQKSLDPYTSVALSFRSFTDYVLRHAARISRKLARWVA